MFTNGSAKGMDCTCVGKKNRRRVYKRRIYKLAHIWGRIDDCFFSCWVKNVSSVTLPRRHNFPKRNKSHCHFFCYVQTAISWIQENELVPFKWFYIFLVMTFLWTTLRIFCSAAFAAMCWIGARNKLSPSNMYQSKDLFFVFFLFFFPHQTFCGRIFFIAISVWAETDLLL